MRLHQLLTAIIFFALLTNVSNADQLIIEPDMGREPIINLIKSSEKSIDLVTYGFTDNKILNPLIDQKKKGRNIKVILEDEPYKAQKQNVKTIIALKNNNIDWQGNIAPFRLIHQKTMIIDDKKALVMTMNFTRSAFNKQRNFGLLIDNKARTEGIESIFNADWNHRPVRKIPHGLIVSPNNSREAVKRMIETAKQEIDIYAPSISDTNIIRALANAANRGIAVNILRTHLIKSKKYKLLKSSGVKIHRNKNLPVHAKAILIDKKILALGSLNLTTSSFDKNRELSAITYDPKIIRQFYEVFSKDWNNSK